MKKADILKHFPSDEELEKTFNEESIYGICHPLKLVGAILMRSKCAEAAEKLMQQNAVGFAEWVHNNEDFCKNFYIKQLYGIYLETLK